MASNKGWKKISYRERLRIEALSKSGLNIAEIARVLNRSKTTISNELKRSSEPYSADEAQRNV